MKTSKPISTISWNSPAYLEQVLRELQVSRIISFWCFICHKGEDDEAGKKDHIHVYLEPTKTIQTVDIRDMFKEIDKDNPKPLGCLDFRPSKFKDWYFYALHDKGYLETKGLVRKFSYNVDNLIVSDDMEMQYRVGSIELYTSTVVEKFKRLAEAGKTWEDMVLAGAIPVGNMNNMERMWGYISDAIRSGRLKSPSAPLADHIPSSQYVGSGAREKEVDLPFNGTIKTKGVPDCSEDDSLH